MSRITWTTLVVTTGLIAWDMSGLDFVMAQAMGGPAGFALRNHWLFADVLHKGGRVAAWAALFALLVAIPWPYGPLRLLNTARRAQLVVSVLLSVLAINVLKSATGIPCPWDIQQFGGDVAFTGHWQQWLSGKMTGTQCFPAGHASAGFAFIGGFFVFRSISASHARRWFWGALAAGTVFGIAQQLRGAHFMSHTLWSAWVCWCVAWGTHTAWQTASPKNHQSPCLTL